MHGQDQLVDEEGPCWIGSDRIGQMQTLETHHVNQNLVFRALLSSTQQATG